MFMKDHMYDGKFRLSYLGSLLKVLMRLLPKDKALFPKSDNFCPTRDISDLREKLSLP